MVFEHLDYNLTDFMREINRKDGRMLSEFEIRIIVKQILLACDYLHSRGFVHRDIKPENFIIGVNSYEVKLIDFGTVKDLENLTAHLRSMFLLAGIEAPSRSCALLIIIRNQTSSQ